MALAIIIFLLSLAGIVGLFVLKEWEIRSNRVTAPLLRDKADQWAFRLKELLVALQADVEKLPPEILHISRLLIHEVALAAATFLRFLEAQAHRLADLVSHKHAFQRRVPRSEFLKKVIDHKNGNTTEEVDTTT